jgi:hypothetical protein
VLAKLSSPFQQTANEQFIEKHTKRQKFCDLRRDPCTSLCIAKKTNENIIDKEKKQPFSSP